MADEEIDRKITVIFATDVVAYSKHMKTDESGTIKNFELVKKFLLGCLRNIRVVCSIPAEIPC